ncbi:glutaredoxin 2 [mine drainage metagenome]|uniref:Glutaredoxin 2 n=1 Tax=mine drainage metagenome TaxID=410659 RepID=A0A1J5SFB4_9ZZZZ
MRARMALSYAGVTVNICEISLKDKPAQMLQVSPKGTVPVLVLLDGKVIDQSLEIMHWALQQRDIDGWLVLDSIETKQLIVDNDDAFKLALDKYKYAIRFPEQSAQDYRSQGEVFLSKLEEKLEKTSFLIRDTLSLADIAIFPFVRQFAGVDPVWFESADYPKLKAWLQNLVESELFKRVMEKQPIK